MEREQASNRADRILGTVGEECAKVAAREKTWDECGLEQKVERLRQEVLRRRPFGEAAYELARKAWTLVQRHVHGPTGEVYKAAADDNLSVGQVGGEAGRYDPLR